MFLFLCGSLILILVVLFLPGRRNLGKSGLRVSCLGLGEFLHRGWKKPFLPVSAPSNKTNVSVSPLLPGTWVTFGSQISDEVRAPLSTCVCQRRPSRSPSLGREVLMQTWVVVIGPFESPPRGSFRYYCCCVWFYFAASVHKFPLVRCWLFLLLSLFCFFFLFFLLCVRWRRTWWPWLMRTGWTSLTQQRFTLQEGAACFYMFSWVTSEALAAERSTVFSFCNHSSVIFTLLQPIKLNVASLHRAEITLGNIIKKKAWRW